MTTEKQREANRLNAQKSTGPRSEAGKARSSQNAITTRLYCNALVLPGESPEKFAELVAQHDLQYNPVTPQARTLVDDLVRNTWLQLRYDVIEHELWDRGLQSVDASDDPNQPKAQTFANFDTLYMRVRRCANTASQAVSRLTRLLKDPEINLPPEEIVAEPEAAVPEAPPESPQLVDSPDPRAEIGFVSREEKRGWVREAMARHMKLDAYINTYVLPQIRSQRLAGGIKEAS